jgi:tetratricopeptide (TPR) repeat protein
MVYVDFIKEIKLQLTKFLGIKSVKALSPWICIEAARGVENRPQKIAVFRNLFRSNIDIIATKATDLIPEKKYFTLLIKLGNICHRHGEIYLAADLFEKVITLAGRKSGYEKQLGGALLGQAAIFSEQAKFKDSKYLLKKAERHFKSIQDKTGQFECENILGTIEAEKGNLSRAQKHFENALALIKGRKALFPKSKIFNNLGIIYNIKGNYTEASRHFSKAGTIFKELKMKNSYVNTKHNMAMLELRKKRYKSALEGFHSCIKLAESEKYHPILGIANAGISEAYFRIGNMRMASLYMERAKSICQISNDRLTTADLYKVQGLIEKKKRNINIAESLFQTSIRINNELKNELNETEAREELGKMLFDNNKKKEAGIELGNALKYYRKISFKSKVSELSSLIKKCN